jgi:hypothetical protein
MKKLFDLGIGIDEETGIYFAIVNSLTDNKTAQVSDPNIRIVLSKLSKMIRKKVKDINCFPQPEPGRIIQLNGKRAQHLTLPTR